VASQPGPQAHDKRANANNHDLWLYLEDDMRISEAVRAGAIDGFLEKPFQIDAVVWLG
jgi:hypothetical protein